MWADILEGVDALEKLVLVVGDPKGRFLKHLELPQNPVPLHLLALEDQTQ